MGWRGWWTLGLAVVVLAPGACTPSAFQCQDAQECSGGTCQPDGYCSFPDQDCPSGQRYGRLAPAGIAGACVDEPPDGSTAASTTGATSTSGTTTTDPSGSATTMAEATSAVSASTSSDSATTTVADPTTGSASTGAVSTGDDDACPELFDDFEDGQIAAAWIVTHPEITEEVGGEVSFAIDPQPGPYPDLRSAERYDLTNAWFRAELGEVPDVMGLQQEIGWSNGDNAAENVRVVLDGDRLFARYNTAPSEFTEIAEITFDASNHRWFGLRAEGTTIHFETSSDGVTFEPYADYDVPFDVSDAQVFLGAGNWTTLDASASISFRSASLCLSPPNE